MTEQTVRQRLAKGVLKKLDGGSESVRLEVLALLDDNDWRVRRNALRFLDHAPVAGMEPAIIALLNDNVEEVRKWAAHALGCDRCKAGAPASLDPVPFLMTTAKQDPSLVVRRSAVVCLAWNRPPDARIARLMRELSASALDEKVRSHALSGAQRHAVAEASTSVA